MYYLSILTRSASMNKRLGLTVFSLFTIVLFCASAHAAEVSKAQIVHITGEAQYMKAGSKDWMPLKEGMVLSEGDAVKTMKDSEVQATLTGANKTADIVVRKES